MGDVEVDRVVGIAMRLFAELGFDGTSLRLIADAAGVDVEWLVERVGDKAQLYREVMARAHDAERKAVETALVSFAQDQRGLIALADAYLDFCVANPQITALWLHRWLGDALDVPGLEALYAHYLSTLVVDAVRPLAPPDVDTDHLVWTIVWCVYGFLAGGIQHPGHHPYRTPGQPPDPQTLVRFRHYLHTLIVRLTTPTDGHP